MLTVIADAPAVAPLGAEVTPMTIPVAKVAGIAQVRFAPPLAGTPIVFTGTVEPNPTDVTADALNICSH